MTKIHTYLDKFKMALKRITKELQELQELQREPSIGVNGGPV